MHFQQIYTPDLAPCSYMIGGYKQCPVVDPAHLMAERACRGHHYLSLSRAESGRGTY